MTKERVPTAIPTRVTEAIVLSKLAVKYFDIMIGMKIEGPLSNNRHLLMNAVQSAFLYGSEVWTI